jgi:signal transduction histidine kinase
MLNKGHTSGVYRSVSPLDGVDRIHAFATLNPSGHYLIVGIGMRDVLDPWRKERFQVFGFISLFLLLMGASSGMAYSAWLRQQRDAEQIRIREALLATANQRLLELNDQKNEFLGIVAHDLRNPLAGIVLATELIEKNKGLDQIHGIVRNMRSEAQEMTALIERFLDIARIDSGDVKAEPEYFDLEPLVQHVAKRFHAKSKQKNINFDFRLPETVTNVYADPKFVKQALDNLVSNAMKFSPPGSTITVRVVEESTEAIVSVEDQGPGLTEEDKAKLFDRFANLSAKPTGGEKSIGLGLSIVKHLVESMAARIWVDSKPGEGASFRIALPRYQPETSAAITEP